MSDKDFEIRKTLWNAEAARLEKAYRFEMDERQVPYSTIITAFILILTINYIALDLMNPDQPNKGWCDFAMSCFETVLGTILYHAAKIREARKAWFNVINNPPTPQFEPDDE